MLAHHPAHEILDAPLEAVANFYALVVAHRECINEQAGCTLLIVTYRLAL